MAKKQKGKSKSDSQSVSRQGALKRNHRTAFLLNDKEKEAIDSYCRKNKIKNKSKFMRETLLRTVMDHFLEDYPTLFDKKDMDRIKV
ncbi:hypothetical protein [Plebeiibacterium marinum]|uniref:Uncharacterized protein n=1 Tax=Plebeiibacterium marinum TaxID=2992111 RepID=A0AAE3SLE8_9BACT|nr:hypothetical protein [Plebeiobacterium marinum]MCW3807533.1 hypothetical protein [Plebeiobacterium marinum]